MSVCPQSYHVGPVFAVNSVIGVFDADTAPFYQVLMKTSATAGNAVLNPGFKDNDISTTPANGSGWGTGDLSAVFTGLTVTLAPKAIGVNVWSIGVAPFASVKVVVITVPPVNPNGKVASAAAWQGLLNVFNPANGNSGKGDDPSTTI